MASGRRIRTRRRVMAGGGAIVATAAVLVAVTTFGNLATPAPVTPATTLQTEPSPVVPPQVDRPPLGDIIHTGITDDRGEVVFYFYKIDAPELPQVHFGLSVAHLDQHNDLKQGLANNEFRRAADAPGFHPIMGGNSESGVFVPTFGYFVGPAAQIRATVLGRTVRAQMATWSEDPTVHAFWFTQDQVPDQDMLGRPVALDANGKRLN
ncbi:hypothetical protein GCM10029964_072810 [Kibdelosporangium lantanae]